MLYIYTKDIFGSVIGKITHGDSKIFKYNVHQLSKD